MVIGRLHILFCDMSVQVLFHVELSFSFFSLFVFVCVCVGGGGGKFLGEDEESAGLPFS